MSKNILLFGIGGLASNYGCEAIVRGTELILNSAFSDYTGTFISFANADFERKRYGSSSNIRFINRSQGPNLFALRLGAKFGLVKNPHLNLDKSLIKKYDCVLSIGGDLYTFADQEKNWSYPWPIVHAGNRIIRTGIPYVIWCASVGPLEKAGPGLPEIKEHLRNCRAIIVREPESYNYLRDRLSLKGNVFLAADPAFLMEPVPFEDSFFAEDDTPILAVNLSAAPIEHVFGSEKLYQIRDRYACILARLIDSLGIRLLLVPHVVGDSDFLTPVYQALSNQYPQRVMMLSDDIGAAATKWAVSQCQGLLTMRFHCALAGIGTATPTIMLLSTDKGRKLWCDIFNGDLDWLIDMKTLEDDILFQKVSDLLQNSDHIHASLQEVVSNMRARTLKAGDILRRVLNS